MDKLAIQAAGTQRTGGTFRDAVMPVFRQRRVVAFMFGVIFLALVLGLFLLPPEYESEMKILINQSPDAVVTSAGASPIPAPIAAVTPEDVNSEAELLKSRDLLERVALACHLERDDTSAWTRTTMWLIDTAGGKPTEQTRLARAVRALREHLVVAPIKNTTMIRVSYSSRSPERSASVLQTLAALYRIKHAAVRAPAKTFDFFDQRAGYFHDELVSAESRLAEFDARESVVAPREQQQLALKQLSDFEAALYQDRTNVYAAEKRAIALKALAASLPEHQTTETREVDNGPLLAQMEGTLLSLQLKHSEMLTKYAPTYPPVREVEAQIADAQQAIAHAQQSPLETAITHRLPAQDWIATESSKVEADRASLEAEVTATNRVVRHYQEVGRRLDRDAASRDELLRNVESARENYRLYLRKSEESRISDALDRAHVLNVAIAEPAGASALPASHTGWILLGGFLLAASVSLGTGYAFDLLDLSFRTPNELGRYLRVEVLASIPASSVNL
ncbi:MAG: GumC family protein [Candidatus Acidiferrales bacterium]